MVMGCYGVGVSRTMAAAIEQNYDDNGIIWPIEIAPYHVLVVPVNTKDEASAAKAEEIYMQLKKVGLETVIDDRNERPGVKFKDADLIGYPLRVVVGPKTLTEGKLEVKIRKTGEIRYLPLDGDYVQDIKNIIAELGLPNKYSVASWRKTFAYHYYHKYKDLSYLQWLFNQTNINMALKFIDEDENMNLRYRDGISL